MKTKILLVDDDKMILKLYKEYFAKYFEINTSISGKDALKIIRDGFQPDIIISDQIMPEMTGSQFLALTKQFLPDSIRILLTADENVKSLVEATNQASAFMYLIKPVREVELIQSVNLAINKIKENRTLQDLNFKIQKLSDNKQLSSLHTPVQADDLMINTIFELNGFQGNYFYNHFKNMLELGQHFIGELKISQEEYYNLFRIVLHYHIMMETVPMRLRFKILELVENSEQEILKNAIKSYFENLVQKHKSNQILSFLTIFEHYDGTGFPNGLRGGQIPITSQIFLLCNIYHHFIYEFPIENIKDRFIIQKFNYRYDIAIEKQKRAIKYIMENNKWFDPGLYDIFRFTIKDNKNELFLPKRENRIIDNLDYIPSFELVFNELEELQYKESKLPELSIEGENTYIIKSLPPNQLTVGMVLNQDIFTKNGIVVVRAGAKINAQLLGNIIALFEKRQLKDIDKIEVKIPAK